MSNARENLSHSNIVDAARDAAANNDYDRVCEIAEVDDDFSPYTHVVFDQMRTELNASGGRVSDINEIAPLVEEHVDEIIASLSSVDDSVTEDAELRREIEGAQINWTSYNSAISTFDLTSGYEL